jgi:hypothetical protein
MDVHTDPLKQTRFFQSLSAAKNRMADNRVVLSKEPWLQSLSDCLLLKEPQRPEAPIGEERPVR